MQRHVARALDDDLNVALPRPHHELGDDREFCDLRGVVGVCQGARPQSVAEAQRDVILAGDVQEIVVALVERVLLPVVGHPLHQKRPTPADDVCQPPGASAVLRDLARHAAVYRDEVHAIAGMVFHRSKHVIGRHVHHPRA